MVQSCLSKSFTCLKIELFISLQVAPAELEAILLTHPSVEDVAVVP